MINKKTTLERKLDNINHTIEPIRTIVPIAILIIQSIILIKLFNQGESNGKIN
jgi:heme/copper-type cytochrome/quinol oxidase subunit 2